MSTTLPSSLTGREKEGWRAVTDKIVSVFIDESGDFGAYEHHAPYDLVAMVLHDQRVNIAADIHGMDERMRNLGYDHRQSRRIQPDASRLPHLALRLQHLQRRGRKAPQ